MNRLLLSIIKKEFRHILRDPQTLWIVIAMPVVMLFLYGYAITLEMKQIEVAVTDYSKTPQSRQFIEHLLATDFFRVTAVDVPATNFERIFKERKARCIVVVPADFARSLNSQTETKIQLLVDATDPNAANYIQKYLMQIGSRFTFENNRFLAQPFVLEQRIFYNPLLKAHNFFVPGLIAVILLMISALLTSIAIVREKEMGTMEQILVSPVRPLQIIIGKVIPYTLLAFLDGLIIVAIGYLWFKVPLNGSVLFLAGTLVIYILTGLSFGLLVSTIAESQRTAMMAAQLATILPTIMLSGFIFPVASMPDIFRYMSLVIPATHFLEIIRGILLKGNTFGDLSAQIGYLLLITLFLIVVSVKKFRTNLE
jgi:ABC-2 type transport system permease protein